MPQSLAQYEAGTFLKWTQRRARVQVRVQLFIEKVLAKKKILVAQRVQIAGQFLRDMVVVNLSRPVRKIKRTRKLTDAQGNVTRVTRTVVDPDSRSKEGEFPRADTTRLMKDIFHKHFPELAESRIGTTLLYGLVLEYKLNRSFLRRTLNEMRQRMLLIIRGH